MIILNVYVQFSLKDGERFCKQIKLVTFCG